MSISRRLFLNGATGLGAGAALAAGAGAVAAAPASTLPVIAASEFGVVADAGADQSRALAAALRAAGERGASLFLSPGTYAAATIHADHPVSILGAPGAVLRQIGPGPVLHIAGAASVTLDGVGFDGAGAAGDARLVQMSGCANVLVRRCTFTAAPSTALALEGVSGRIAHNTFEGARGAALFALDSRGLEISANHVRNCGNNGILVWRGTVGEDATIIAGNRIEHIGATDGGSGQNGNGINLYRAGGAIVASNRITDCAFTAVRWNTGHGCQILGNSCARLGEVALYAEFAFEGAIISGNLVQEAASGISITNFNEGGRLAVCSGNIVRDLFVRAGEVDQRGVGISAEADALIEGNVVENAPRYGIALGWGRHLRDVSATGNVVRNSAVGIAVSVSPGAGRALVANNLISGAPSGAIVGFDRHDIVTGDLSAAGAVMPANLSAQGNIAA